MRIGANVDARLQPIAAELLSLAGRSLVVTGGSGGIGGAVVALLTRCGAEVISVDLPERQAPATAAATFACDLGDRTAVRALGDTLAARWPRLHGLVHCAGVARDAVLWKLDDDDWDLVRAVNLHAAFWLLRALAPSLRAAGDGTVVFTTSINGVRGKRGQANYSASKAGLVGLARTAARELGRFGVRVNCVAPGMVATAMTVDLPGEVQEAAVAETVLGRLGQPHDVARAVLFLCSELSSHVTGQVLHVDGGQCMC